MRSCVPEREAPILHWFRMLQGDGQILLQERSRYKSGPLQELAATRAGRCKSGPLQERAATRAGRCTSGPPSEDRVGAVAPVISDLDRGRE
jgi:hypothetical protein